MGYLRLQKYFMSSVTETASIKAQDHANNCLSNGVYQAAAIGDFLIQNPVTAGRHTLGL